TLCGAGGERRSSADSSTQDRGGRSFGMGQEVVSGWESIGDRFSAGPGPASKPAPGASNWRLRDLSFGIIKLSSAIVQEFARVRPGMERDPSGSERRFAESSAASGFTPETPPGFRSRPSPPLRAVVIM